MEMLFIETVKQNKRLIFAEINEGVEKYLKIQDRFRSGRIDKEFESTFLGFYRLNRRKTYVDLDAMRTMLRDKNDLSIREIISDLSGTTVEFSFATKVKHTINDQLPIYDKHVRDFFGFRRPNGIDSAVNCYENLCGVYRQYSEYGLADLKVAFDEGFPTYKDKISDVKKIDFMIWGGGGLHLYDN